ncbi:hypothetical protein QR98_0003510 [Sarcoptes scabiei]|uniref:Uncharacterized protein n=1 Tax=Sarcoptes scabiei TaxID=52283 RepID=A0A131ZT70_SARSC|nr:hypothetical protein QR98_0003510 [Sarcoptes scabiei]
MALLFSAGLFNSEDTKLDYVLKISATIILLCFLDAQQTTTLAEISIIVFYIAIEIIAFGTFVSVCRQNAQLILISGGILFALFFLGLFSVQLKENIFCFVLLFACSIQNIVLGIYFQTIEKCQLRQHGFDCRGQCVQQEYLDSIDSRLGGRLKPIYQPFFRINNPQQTHNLFHNPVEQPEPPPIKSDRNEETISKLETVESSDHSNPIDSTIAIITTAISKENKLNGNLNLFSNDTVSNLRQSQYNQTSIQHLDTSSFLQ